MRARAFPVLKESGGFPWGRFVIQAGSWIEEATWMAKPYSLDLRERIVRAVEAGSSRRGAAEQFSVSESCALKLVPRWRRTGSVAPGRGRKKPVSLAEACVRALLAAEPDATLEELKAQVAGQGIVVGPVVGRSLSEDSGHDAQERRSTPPSRLVPTLPRSRGGSTSRSWAGIPCLH